MHNSGEDKNAIWTKKFITKRKLSLNTIKNVYKIRKLRSQQRFKSEGHNVFTEKDSIKFSWR